MVYKTRKHLLLFHLLEVCHKDSRGGMEEQETWYLAFLASIIEKSKENRL